METRYGTFGDPLDQAEPAMRPICTALRATSRSAVGALIEAAVADREA